MDVPRGRNAQDSVWKIVEEYDDGSQPIEVGRHHHGSRAPSMTDISAGVQAAMHLAEGRQYNNFGAQINNNQINIQNLTLNYGASQSSSENSSVVGAPRPSDHIDRRRQWEGMSDLRTNLPDSDTASLMTTEKPMNLCKFNGIYVNSLLGLHDGGYPLYFPGLNLERPERHQACGISPGDVGFITPEGYFNSLFNILGRDEPANEGIRPPANFTPLDVATRTLGQGVANTQSLYPPVRVEVENLPHDGVRRFRSRAPEAGILHLPKGGVVQSVDCGQGFLRSYARRHVRDWYEYAKRERRFSVHNGSIYLIDRCEKTNAWGIAVFINPHLRMLRRQEVLLDFKTEGSGGAGVAYTWESRYDADTRINVTPISGTTHSSPHNQCTFIRGYKLLLRDPKFNKRPKIIIFLSHLFGNLFCFPKPEKHSGGSSGGQETNTSEVPENLGRQGLQNSMALESETNGPTHPSDVVNEFLLQEIPGCEVAITHDDDWMLILKDAKSRELDLETYELKGSINELFNIHNDDGAVYLECKRADDVRMGTDEPQATPQSLEASLKRLEGLPEPSPVQAGQVKGPTPSHFQDDALARVRQRDHSIAEPFFKSLFSGKRR